MIKQIKMAKDVAVALYVVILISTVGIAGMLCWQYRFFMQETQELILVKESYYQHVEMLKRSLSVALSENSSESDDEPDDEDSKKKNELISGDLQPNLFITAVDEDDTVLKNAEIEFDLITPEEEYRLSSIKKNPPKLKTRTALSKKKNKRTKSSALSKHINRYAAPCDYTFMWPIELSKFWLSSLYGPRRLSNRKVSFHHGIDMASVKGTAVKAAAAGKVVCAYSVSGYGNCVDIVHNNRYKTRYAHLNSIRVRVGQEVEAGQVVGTVGSTGFVRKSGTDASHLHFEIHQDGHTVNPLKFLFT